MLKLKAAMRICFLSTINKTFLAVLLIATLFVIFFYLAAHESPDEIVISRKFNFVAAPPVPFFKRFEAARHLNCEKLFENQDNSTYKQEKVKVDLDALEFDMSCSAIMKRNFFPHIPLSPDEASFPLAFAKVVYKDYLYLEADLASFYAPQNAYCFSIDSKADWKFKSRIHTLSKCFSNVIYTSNQFDVDSGGHNMDASHLVCMKALRSYRPWKYVALLQNYDSAIKTNAEMVQIYRWLGGANDVELNPPFMERIDQSLDWTFKGLNLFKNSTKNTDQKIAFAKGYNECSLSRAAVDYIFDELNVDKLVFQLNSGSFGIDEILIPTLQTDDAIGLPGGITRRCLDEKVTNSHFTRKSIWGPSKNCPSDSWRHGICIFGTEMLAEMENWPELFGNKFIPEMDYGAFECMRERLYNRTYAVDRMLPEDTLNELVYKTHIIVRYNRERRRLKFDKKKFSCNYQHVG
uniref:Lactosylceramide 4-alpha-galactosyltransferase n=1 Tax=Panagrellus redivivus TaxID=6233 RepID=A0A7E4VCX6_PANRE